MTQTRITIVIDDDEDDLAEVEDWLRQGEYRYSRETLRRSGEWVLIHDVYIADPDGWDRTDFQRSWNEHITQDEFLRRLRGSTHAKNSDLRASGLIRDS